MPKLYSGTNSIVPGDHFEVTIEADSGPEAGAHTQSGQMRMRDGETEQAAVENIVGGLPSRIARSATFCPLT
jgi:hypothetical protein